MFKTIHRYLHRRWRKHYLKSHWNFILDLSLTIVIIFLIAVVSGLYFFRPSFSYSGVHRQVKVDLNNPPLVLNFSVGHQAISTSQPVSLKINFKNSGVIPVKDVVVDFNAVGDNFILDKISLVSSTFDNVKLNGLVLSMDEISKQQSGDVDLLVYFKNKNQLSREINWLVQSQYSFDKQIFNKSQNLPPLKISAHLNAKASAYYTSSQGDQLGIGPVPPIVGIPTVYWIFWQAESLNNFEDRVSEILVGIFSKYREFPYCKPKRFKTTTTPYKKETLLHKQFSEHKYTTSKKFGGSTEFFDVSLEVVVAAYDDLIVVYKPRKTKAKPKSKPGVFFSVNKAV
jgi:hypothetical protein